MFPRRLTVWAIGATRVHCDLGITDSVLRVSLPPNSSSGNKYYCLVTAPCSLVEVRKGLDLSHDDTREA